MHVLTLHALIEVYSKVKSFMANLCTSTCLSNYHFFCYFPFTFIFLKLEQLVNILMQLTIMSKFTKLSVGVLWHFKLTLMSMARFSSPFWFLKFPHLKLLSKTISILIPFRLNAQGLFSIVNKFFSFKYLISYTLHIQPF